MRPGESASGEGPAGEARPSFSELLRGHRHAVALTQVELAGRAGLGVRTVRDLERGRAARPQRSTVELLARALGLVDADLAAFIAAARSQKAPPSVPPPADRTGQIRRPAGITLPPPPHLLGRDGELESLAAHLVARPGLTTLVGMAGVGKSALSLAVAHRADARLPGGMGGVSVDAGDTEADVWDVVSAVLGVSRHADLSRRLAEPTLLMLDGVDKAPEASTQVLAELIAMAPQIRIIASARGPLGLPGEHVWPVAPLELPPAEVDTLTQARSYAASALFLSRWIQVRGQPPADTQIPALIALVRRLGGLPLAIELAAARARVLDPPEMLARYGDRLLDLGGPDPGAETVTLRDVVTASYRLLAPAQRTALRWLAGFGYRWSVELAEDLIGPDTDVVLMLDRLVELGLVQVRGTGALRFVLLDVVKAFALEQADLTGETVAIRRRHAEVFTRFAARIAPDLVGVRLTSAVAALDEVATDLWSALAHSAVDDPGTALCLASKLPRWWRFRGRSGQGREWLVRLLADPRTGGVDQTVRAWAQLGVVQLSAEAGVARAELPRAEAALAHFVEIGDVTGEVAARASLIMAHQSLGGHAEARRHAEATLAVATRTGRVRDMAISQNNLIWHDLRVGDLVTAQRRLEAVDRLAARSGEHKLRALARANLAEVLRLRGNLDEAVHVGRQAAEMLAEVGDPGHRRRILGVIGLAQAVGGALEDAEKTLNELRALQPYWPDSGIEPVGPIGTWTAHPVPSSAAEQSEDWHCAMIEAVLSRRRGERALAAAWYSSAAAASTGVSDQRDIVEALIGLAAMSDAPRPVLAKLDRLCEQAGITLTPLEQAEVAELR